MNIILTLSHAKLHPSFSDPEVQTMLLSGERFGQVVRPGAYLVDAIPWLKYLPDSIYTPMKELKRYSKDEYDLFKDMMDVVRERMVSLSRCLDRISNGYADKRRKHATVFRRIPY